MVLEKIAGAAELPVTLHEAKTHAKVIGDQENDLILGWMAAATEYCEQSVEGGLSLISQQWRLTLPAWTVPIVVPRPPLEAVVDIMYWDPDGSQQTLDVGAYRVLLSWKGPGLLYPVDQWPSHYARPDAISVAFTAGFGARADVPAIAKMAILKVVTEFYEQREDSVIGAPSNATAIGVARMMSKMSYGFYG